MVEREFIIDKINQLFTKLREYRKCVEEDERKLVMLHIRNDYCKLRKLVKDFNRMYRKQLSDAKCEKLSGQNQLPQAEFDSKIQMIQYNINWLEIYFLPKLSDFRNYINTAILKLKAGEEEALEIIEEEGIGSKENLEEEENEEEEEEEEEYDTAEEEEIEEEETEDESK